MPTKTCQSGLDFSLLARPYTESTHYVVREKTSTQQKTSIHVDIFSTEIFLCVHFSTSLFFHNSRSAGRVAFVDLPFCLCTAAAVQFSIGSESKCDYYTQSSIIMNLYRNSISIELKLKNRAKEPWKRFSQLNCAKPFDFTSTPLSLGPSQSSTNVMPMLMMTAIICTPAVAPTNGFHRVHSSFVWREIRSQFSRHERIHHKNLNRCSSKMYVWNGTT